MRQPHIYSDPPAQFSVFGKTPIQNMFNVLCNYMATPNCSDGELGKSFLLMLYLGMYGVSSCMKDLNVRHSCS